MCSPSRKLTTYKTFPTVFLSVSPAQTLGDLIETIKRQGFVVRKAGNTNIEIYERISKGMGNLSALILKGMGNLNSQSLQ